MMSESEKPKKSKAPGAYKAFINQFPELGEAWQSMANAGQKGPLDEQTIRLVKLGIAIGAQRSGAVSSATRKASDAGVDRDAMLQIVALAASTIGMPASVASFCWINEALEKLNKTAED